MDLSKKFIASSTAGVSAFLPMVTLAQYGGMAGGSSLSINSLGIAIGNAVWIVFTVIAVIAFVISGVLFLTSMGETEKLKTARQSAVWGVVGVVVAILAYSAVRLVRGSIGA